MKIKIESDVFDIVERIKDIDENYYLMYNVKTNKYELHNSDQACSYCLSIPYDELDSRIIELIFATNTANMDRIIEYIDNYNSALDINSTNSMRNESDYKLREIYAFANNSSKMYNCNSAFKEVWK